MTKHTKQVELANKNTDTSLWKDSRDPIERMAYWINWLSPHNLWKAKKPIQDLVTQAQQEAVERERERIKKILGEKNTENDIYDICEWVKKNFYPSQRANNLVSIIQASNSQRNYMIDQLKEDPQKEQKQP